MTHVSKICQQLESAHNWLAHQQGQAYSPKQQRRVTHLVQACVILLSRSVRDYSAWARRRGRARKIKGRYTSPPNNKALRDLVELTVSDLEANSPFQPKAAAPWQLESWAGSRFVCQQCGGEFTAKRAAKYCSPGCRVTAHRRRDPEPAPASQPLQAGVFPGENGPKEGRIAAKERSGQSPRRPQTALKS